MTENQSFASTNVSSYETAQQLHDVGLSVIDSLVILTPRDTIRRIRYLRASTQTNSTFIEASTSHQTDTAISTSTEMPIKPIAAQSKKRGGASLCASVRMALWLIFLIFLTYLLLRVKKRLLLRHK